MMLRIKNHPILSIENSQEIYFIFEGQQVMGYQGDTIASALCALGILTLSHSIHHQRPRGFYCAIGNCSSCNMIVNGVANVRTCMTLLEPEMVVTRQKNKGELR